MKVRENSMPEKKRINAKCVRFRSKWELVLWKGLLSGEEDSGFACADLEAERVVGFVAVGDSLRFAEATLLGRVSGRQA